MEFTHEVAENNVLVIDMSGDLIGENNGPELVTLVNDQIKGRYSNR